MSSELAAVEVVRAARRLIEPAETGEAIAEQVLAGVDLVALNAATLAAARHTTPPSLRTLDAIHLQTALEVGDVDEFICYDERLAGAARAAGLVAVAPA